MGNFERLKALLKKYCELSNDNATLCEDINKNYQRIINNNKEVFETLKEKFETDLQSLIQELIESWGISSNDLVLTTYFYGGNNNQSCPLSYFLSEGCLVIWDSNNSEEHHFGIGKKTFNRNGGMFALNGNNVDENLKVDVMYSNGEFRSVVNDIDSPVWNDVMIQSNPYGLLIEADREKFYETIRDIESADDFAGLEDALKSKNWLIFIRACDRYAEKLKTQENPTM